MGSRTVSNPRLIINAILEYSNLSRKQVENLILNGNVKVLLNVDQPVRFDDYGPLKEWVVVKDPNFVIGHDLTDHVDCNGEKIWMDNLGDWHR